MFDVVAKDGTYISLGWSLTAALSYARRYNGYAIRPATGEIVYP